MVTFYYGALRELGAARTQDTLCFDTLLSATVTELVHLVFTLGSALSFSPSESSNPDSVHGRLCFLSF